MSSYYKVLYDTTYFTKSSSTNTSANVLAESVETSTVYSEEDSLDYQTTGKDWKPYKYPLINSTDIAMGELFKIMD